MAITCNSCGRTYKTKATFSRHPCAIQRAARLERAMCNAFDRGNVSAVFDMMFSVGTGQFEAALIDAEQTEA